MTVRIDRYLVDDLEMAKNPKSVVRAAGTVPFSVDGVEYEIDLTAEHKGELLDALRPYTAAGRKTRHKRSPRPVAGRQQAVRIREWARERGIDVNDRGRIPQPIIEEYQAAHAAATA